MNADLDITDFIKK